jgi:hypothetical protein
MASNGRRRQVLKHGKVGRRNQLLGRLVAFWVWRPEFPRRPFQLTSQNTNFSRCIESNCHSIARNPADFQHDIVPDVNPFADFSTEHQHDQNSFVLARLACRPHRVLPGGHAVACCDWRIEKATRVPHELSALLEYPGRVNNRCNSREICNFPATKRMPAAVAQDLEVEMKPSRFETNVLN